jgi:hypothetical protein
VSGAFIGYTPLPDATTWKLEPPGGIAIEPDGKVGLLRVTVWRGENRLAVDHALRPGESSEGIARALQVQGLKQPRVLLNGRAVSAADADGRIALSTAR